MDKLKYAEDVLAGIVKYSQWWPFNCSNTILQFDSAVTFEIVNVFTQ